MTIKQNGIVTVHTDGSCLGNLGPGGWAAIIQYPGFDKPTIRSGNRADPTTTNNQMELQAVIEGLNRIKYPSTVCVYSDSQYVINTIEKNWKRKKNTDLWPQLDQAIARHKQVTWQWIKGHSGNEMNELADSIANKEARSAALRRAV